MVMKARRLIAGLLLAAVALAPSAAYAFRVGYVDLQRALNESKAGKRAKAEFKAKVDKLEKQLRGQKKELDRIKQELERKAVVMRPEERRKLEGDFEHKQLDLKRKYEDSQAELQQKDAELTGKILRGLQEVVQKLGKERGYDLILSLGSGSVLFYRKDDDLTDEVMRIFDERS